MFKHLLFFYTIILILRLFVHLYAAYSMAKYTISDDVDTVRVTEGAYNGILAITLFEVFYYIFMIMAVKFMNNTIEGGSQILFVALIVLCFLSTNLFLLCWWTSSFGKANKFNKTYS